MQNSQLKPSGGTWPKVITGASIPEFAQLSIYKRTKQRKSIFDVNAFKRPEAPPKLDYMSLSQLPKHSPQSSMSESAQTPPTPPARSDSFRFKHRQQNSSASDSTITTGTPPASPAQTTSQGKGEMGSQLYYMDAPPRETKTPVDEERSRRRAEERGKRRYRPKSAPALRRNVTPVHIPVPMQVIEACFVTAALLRTFVPVCICCGLVSGSKFLQRWALSRASGPAALFPFKNQSVQHSLCTSQLQQHLNA